MMKRVVFIKVGLISAFLAAAGLLTVSNVSHAQKAETAGQKFKSIQVLNDMPADQMGKVMNMMSASLGVNCGFCHESNDGGYEKEGFEHKDMARKMMRMTFDLNKTQFNGRPEINCNTCHNGKSHPQPSFPLAPVVQPERPAQPATKPTADQIVDKYLNAVGAAASFEKIKSRVITASRIEPDGKTTESETIWLSGKAYRSDLAYGKYIVSEIFDGTAAKKYGNGAEIELKADELEQIRRDAELFSPWNLRKIYAKLEYRSFEKIDGRDVFTLAATTSGNVRERLAFDAVTGLLVRRTVSSPTIFGNFVYQVDYADYKDFGGVKMPTTMRYAVPNIRWTRKLIDVKMNVPVENNKFTSPKP
jgi:photosynthetic reaction center cytochrome c subunit